MTRFYNIVGQTELGTPDKSAIICEIQELMASGPNDTCDEFKLKVVAMPLRIDPRVDYASKKMLGSPEHPAVTIHFLNSMLKFAQPVVAVTILNPLVGRDRSEDKIIVLDILAKDSTGRLFNIEVQTRLPLCFTNRLLYYNCRNYWRQLHEGDGYTKLRPAISISLIDRRMFHESERAGLWHHSFRLRCDQDHRLAMTDDFEFHIVELPKFRPESDNIGDLPPDQKWL